MSAVDGGRASRLADVVAAVARQALADRGASRIALLDDGGPEAELAARILAGRLGEDAVVRVTAAEPEVESLLHLLPGISRERAAGELRSTRARGTADALAANPANKTALLLGGDLPPEPLLPLGDLWASDVAAFAGSWSAPAEVRSLAEACGGIDSLDAALRATFDARDPAALERLPADARDAVRRALAAGRASRVAPRIVPKLGYRTLGVDLFE